MTKTFKFYLLLLPLFLAGCTTIRSEISNAGGSGITRVFYIIGGLFLLLIAILLMFGMMYALRRWRFLELIKPGLWLSRLPIIGPYMSKALGVQRDLRQITSYQKTLKRYGVDTGNVLGKGGASSPNFGQASGARPSALPSSSSSSASTNFNKYLPKEVKKLTKGQKISAADIQKKGKGFFRRFWGNEPSQFDEPIEAQIEVQIIDTIPYVSPAVSAASVAYFNESLSTQGLTTASLFSLEASHFAASATAPQVKSRPPDISLPALVVSMEQVEDRYFPINNPKIVIGSAADCDIVLTEPGVGPKHLQIDQTETGWTLTDLGALGGTFLDASQLLSNVPEIWTTNYPVIVGPLSIRVIEMSGVEYDEMFNRVDHPSNDKPGITIFPEQQECEAGQITAWQLHITNQGKSVDHFAVIITGFPVGWVTIEQEQKPLMPGESTTVPLSIAPPRTSAASAGVHVGAVRVQAVSVPEAFQVAEFKLEINPFDAWHTEMSHHQFKADTEGALIIRNGGNYKTSLEVGSSSDSDRFEIYPFLETKLFELEAGKEASVNMAVENLRRPWFGMIRNESFMLSAASGSGEYAIQHPGVVEVRPIIPTWLASIVGFLIPFVCLFATIGYTFVENRNAAATATAEALALANLALTPTATPIPTATPRPVLYPSSCAHLKSFREEMGEAPDPNVGWEDGEYELYANGLTDLPMTIYCHGMNSTSPAEYISLQEVGETVNFSRYTFEDGEILVMFQKIRVDPYNLIVDVTDRTFTETVDTRIEQEFDPPDFGSAKGCTALQSSPVAGEANINLSGTQYTLPSIDGLFVAEGKSLVGESIRESAEGLTVDLSVNGACGWLFPQSDIQLLLVDAQ
ncbi:MAG: GON domain-containing protein [Chloroflexota bacterium]